jgi:hypothetical protein
MLVYDAHSRRLPASIALVSARSSLVPTTLIASPPIAFVVKWKDFASPEPHALPIRSVSPQREPTAALASAIFLKLLAFQVRSLSLSASLGFWRNIDKLT